MDTQETTAMEELHPQPVYIIVEKSSNKKSANEAYHSKAAGIIGIIHIVCGLVAFGTAVGLIFNRSFGLELIGCGIWCSVFFFISGGLSIASCRVKHSGFVISTLVMSIFSAIFSGILIIFSAIGLVIFDCYASSYICNDLLNRTLYGLQLIAGVTELVISITSSCLSCKATCCRGKLDTNLPSNRVIYKPTGDKNLDKIVSLALMAEKNTEPNEEECEDLPKYEDVVETEEGDHFDYKKL